MATETFLVQLHERIGSLGIERIKNQTIKACSIYIQHCIQGANEAIVR